MTRSLRCGRPPVPPDRRRPLEVEDFGYETVLHAAESVAADLPRYSTPRRSGSRERSGKQGWIAFHALECHPGFGCPEGNNTLQFIEAARPTPRCGRAHHRVSVTASVTA